MGTIADFKITGETTLDGSGLTSQLNAITVAAGNLLSGLVTKAADAASSAAKYAVSTGMAFDSAMSEVEAISGASGEALQALSDKAQEMGTTTKFTATEAAEALKYMAMAGWEPADMLNSLNGVMNLAAASGEDLAVVSDIVTDAMTAFGLAADGTTNGVANATHFADVLAAAASSANTNVGMLGESFKYVAPLAGALGYTVEDASVALGVMANSGIKASQAGTYLRAILSNLAKPSSETADYIDALGLSLENADGSTKSLAEVMQDLRTSFAGLTEAEKTEYAAGVAGREGMAGLLALVNASDEDFDALTEAIYSADGAAEKMAATMLDNLAGDMTLLSSAADGLAMALYDAFSVRLRDVVQLCTGFVGELQAALEAGGPAGMAQAAGQMVGGLVQGLADKLPELLTQGTQMAVALIGSLTDGVRQAIPEFLGQALPMLVSFTGSLRENAGRLVDAGLALIQSLADGLIDSLPVLIANVPLIVSNIAGIINDNAPKLLGAAATLIVKLAKGLIDNIPVLVQNLPRIITAIVDVITAFNWLDLGKTIVTGIKNGIVGMVSSIGQSARGLAQNVNDVINNWGWNTLGKTVVEGLRLGIESLKDAIPNLFKLICEAAGKKFASFDWVGLGKNIVAGIAGGITGSLKGLLDTVGNMASGVLNKVKDVLGIHSPSKEFASIGVNVVQGLANGILASAQQVEAAAKQLAIDTANAYVEAAGQQLEEAQERLSKATTKAAKAAAQAAVEAAKQQLKEAQQQAAADKELAADLERIAAGLGEGTGIHFVTSLVGAVKNQDWAGVASIIAQGIFSRMTAEQQTAIAGWVASAMEQLNTGFATDGVAGMLKAGTSLIQALVTGLQSNSGVFLQAAQSLMGGFSGIVQSTLPGVQKAISGVSAALSALVPTIDLASAAQAIFNAVMNANPIILVISLIGMLATALIGFSKTNGEVGSGFAKVWKGIKSVFDFVVDAIIASFGVIIQGFVNLINGMIWVANLIPGVNIGYVSNPAFDLLEKRRAQRQEEERKLAELEQSQAENYVPEYKDPEIELPELPAPADKPLTDATEDLTDAIKDQTEATKAAVQATQEGLAAMVQQAKGLVLSDNMAVANRVAANGSAYTAQLAAAYQAANSGAQPTSGTTVIQNIYSKAQTAADLAQETRWEYDRAART